MASATVSSFAARLRQLQLDVCRLPSVQRRQMRALLRDALQLVESGTSSTRARPALRTSRSTSGMSRIVTSGGGWTRVTYRRPCISYPRARGVGQRSRLELLSGARRGRRRGARGSVGTSGAGESPRRLNTVTLRQILGMAQQSVTGFKRLVDGVVPVDTDVAMSDDVAIATIRSLQQSCKPSFELVAVPNWAAASDASDQRMQPWLAQGRGVGPCQ